VANKFNSEINNNIFMPKRGFASDNNAGVHPEIMKALNEVNVGHSIAYGDDPYTSKTIQSLRKIFGPGSSAFLVFNGTAANVLGLNSLTQPYNAIICAETAHINVDECGAPERFTGCKLLSVSTANGKLSIEGIQKHMHGFGFEHHSQPKIISISQSTEMGTVYTPDEIRELSDFAHHHDMKLHMDGARISNAAVSLGIGFKEFTSDAGVDILSFGGTKNGMMYGEAVVFFNSELASDFKYHRKQGMQLASKMRFISAQYIAYFRNDLWKKCAAHSNSMARMLAERLLEFEEIKITQSVQSNGVFVIMPSDIAEKMRNHFFFYPWNEKTSEYRLMTSWDTAEEDIEEFISLLSKELHK